MRSYTAVGREWEAFSGFSWLFVFDRKEEDDIKNFANEWYLLWWVVFLFIIVVLYYWYACNLIHKRPICVYCCLHMYRYVGCIASYCFINEHFMQLFFCCLMKCLLQCVFSSSIAFNLLAFYIGCNVYNVVCLPDFKILYELVSH